MSDNFPLPTKILKNPLQAIYQNQFQIGNINAYESFINHIETIHKFEF